MGGKIWVESEERKGTRFHFTMFLNTLEEKGPDPSIPKYVADAPSERRQCLIIEHSPIVRKLLARDIGVLGLHETAVASIAEAQTCFQLKSYSIVIVDGTLSEAAQFIQSLGTAAPDARVIVTSVLGTLSDLDGANVVTTIVKPIRRWRLMKALETGLSQSPLRKNLVDLGNLDKDSKRHALASLGFRHPLRILVMSLFGRSNLIACGRQPGQHPSCPTISETHGIYCWSCQRWPRGSWAMRTSRSCGFTLRCYSSRYSDAEYGCISSLSWLLLWQGYEATRILKQQYPDNIRPAIVALTANATQADKDRSLEAGMDGHISKPIRPNMLAEVLGSIKPKRSTSWCMVTIL